MYFIRGYDKLDKTRPFILAKETLQGFSIPPPMNPNDRQGGRLMFPGRIVILSGSPGVGKSAAAALDRFMK